MSTLFETSVESSRDMLAFKGFVKEFPKKAAGELFDELLDIANDLRNNIMDSMANTERDTSKAYPKVHTPLSKRKTGAASIRYHYPSKPGKPPAPDTGRLMNSFKINVGRTTVEVGTPVQYAAALEYGKKPQTIPIKEASILSDGVNFFGASVKHPGIAPRPFMEPALDKIDFDDRLMKAIKRSL